MRAVCWEGIEKIQVETVPDRVILKSARRDHQGDDDRDLQGQLWSLCDNSNPNA